MIENNEFGIKYNNEDINIGKVGVDNELVNLQKLLTATDNNLDVLMYLSHKTSSTTSVTSTNSATSTDTLDTTNNNFEIYKTYSVVYLPDNNNDPKFIFIDPNGYPIGFPVSDNIQLIKGKTYRFIQFTGSNRSGIVYDDVNTFDLFFSDNSISNDLVYNTSVPNSLDYMNVLNYENNTNMDTFNFSVPTKKISISNFEDEYIWTIPHDYEKDKIYYGYITNKNNDTTEDKKWKSVGHMTVLDENIFTFDVSNNTLNYNNNDISFGNIVNTIKSSNTSITLKVINNTNTEFKLYQDSSELTVDNDGKIKINNPAGGIKYKVKYGSTVNEENIFLEIASNEDDVSTILNVVSYRYFQESNGLTRGLDKNTIESLNNDTNITNYLTGITSTGSLSVLKNLESNNNTFNIRYDTSEKKFKIKTKLESTEDCIISEYWWYKTDKTNYNLECSCDTTDEEKEERKRESDIYLSDLKISKNGNLNVIKCKLQIPYKKLNSDKIEYVYIGHNLIEVNNTEVYKYLLPKWVTDISEASEFELIVTNVSTNIDYTNSEERLSEIKFGLAGNHIFSSKGENVLEINASGDLDLKNHNIINFGHLLDSDDKTIGRGINDYPAETDLNMNKNDINNISCTNYNNNNKIKSEKNISAKSILETLFFPLDTEVETFINFEQLAPLNDKELKIRDESSGDTDKYYWNDNNLSANPSIELIRNRKYKIRLDNLTNNIRIQKTIDLCDNELYSNGLTHSDGSIGVQAQDKTSGILTFTVPSDAPDILYYRSNNSMNIIGILNIVSHTKKLTLARPSSYGSEDTLYNRFNNGILNYNNNIPEYIDCSWNDLKPSNPGFSNFPNNQQYKWDEWHRETEDTDWKITWGIPIDEKYWEEFNKDILTDQNISLVTNPNGANKKDLYKSWKNWGVRPVTLLGDYNKITSSYDKNYNRIVPTRHNIRGTQAHRYSFTGENYNLVLEQGHIGSAQFNLTKQNSNVKDYENNISGSNVYKLKRTINTQIYEYIDSNGNEKVNITNIQIFNSLDKLSGGTGHNANFWNKQHEPSSKAASSGLGYGFEFAPDDNNPTKSNSERGLNKITEDNTNNTVNQLYGLVDFIDIDVNKLKNTTNFDCKIRFTVTIGDEQYEKTKYLTIGYNSVLGGGQGVGYYNINDNELNSLEKPIKYEKSPEKVVHQSLVWLRTNDKSNGDDTTTGKPEYFYLNGYRLDKGSESQTDNISWVTPNNKSQYDASYNEVDRAAFRLHPWMLEFVTQGFGSNELEDNFKKTGDSPDGGLFDGMEVRFYTTKYDSNKKTYVKDTHVSDPSMGKVLNMNFNENGRGYYQKYLSTDTTHTKNGWFDNSHNVSAGWPQIDLSNAKASINDEYLDWSGNDMPLRGGPFNFNENLSKITIEDHKMDEWYEKGLDSSNNHIGVTSRFRLLLDKNSDIKQGLKVYIVSWEDTFEVESSLKNIRDLRHNDCAWKVNKGLYPYSNNQRGKDQFFHILSGSYTRNNNSFSKTKDATTLYKNSSIHKISDGSFADIMDSSGVVNIILKQGNDYSSVDANNSSKNLFWTMEFYDPLLGSNTLLDIPDDSLLAYMNNTENEVQFPLENAYGATLWTNDASNAQIFSIELPLIENNDINSVCYSTNTSHVFVQEDEVGEDNIIMKTTTNDTNLDLMKNKLVGVKEIVDVKNNKYLTSSLNVDIDANNKSINNINKLSSNDEGIVLDFSLNKLIINKKNFEGLNELGCDTIRCKKIICEEIYFSNSEYPNKYINLGLDIIDRRSEMGNDNKYINYNLTMKNNMTSKVHLAFNDTNIIVDGTLGVNDNIKTSKAVEIDGSNVYLDTVRN